MMNGSLQGTNKSGDGRNQQDFTILSEEKSNNTGNGDHGIRMDDPNPSQMPKKPYERYSAQQVLRMQEFYRKNTHPDDNEWKALGQEFGLDPLQVNFCSKIDGPKIRKTMIKLLNKQLREEKEKLRVDNRMLKHALGFPICQNCGGPSTNEMSATRMELLRAENAFIIKEEIHRWPALWNGTMGWGLCRAYFMLQRRQPGHLITDMLLVRQLKIKVLLEKC